MSTGACRESLTVVDRCRANLFRVCPYLSPGALPEDASLLRLIAEERVEFAQGDSDDETIRDRDLNPKEDLQRLAEMSPKGYFRPYCYRLEFCKSSEKAV